MGFELLSVNYLLPQRLFSLVSSVGMLGVLKRADLVALMQPSALVESASAREQSERLTAAAVRCKLLSETTVDSRELRLAVDVDRIQSVEAFRNLLQEYLLGVCVESADHFILNQVAAWYAVQNEKVLGLTKSEFERQFNGQLYSGASERKFSEQPGVTTWIVWAEFLGWGWPTPFGTVSNVRLAPDATLRIRPLLEGTIRNADKVIPFGTFMAELSNIWPELDGGILFEQCWQASRGNEVRGNRPSLMLSTALRTLHNLGELELIDRPDASETWALFPAQSHIGRVSHIRRKAVA